MAELWVFTAKYFLLAIREFTAQLSKLRDAASNLETKKKLDNLIEFHSEVSRKIEVYNLNLADPNRHYPDEQFDIKLNLTDKEIQYLVRLTYRMLQKWKDRLQEIRDLEFKTESKEDEAVRLNALIWPLEATFNHSQTLFGKYKGLGPAIFPSENGSVKIDKVDRALQSIGNYLLEMRKGMWAALDSNSPDAGRQAAHSARELIDQTLKEGSPKNLNTRKDRGSHIMKQYRKGEVSDLDLEIIDANWNLIDVEHRKLLKLAHGRSIVNQSEIRGSVEAAERILRLLFNIE